MNPTGQTHKIDLTTTGTLPTLPDMKLPLIDKVDCDLAFQLMKKYYPLLEESNAYECQSSILRHLNLLKSVYPNLTDLRGKLTLDLACGSRVYENKTKNAFDPWMPRLLLELGAIPVGVDLAPQIDEQFDAYQADLTILDSLSFLPTGKFDFCNIDKFPTKSAMKVIQERKVDWIELKANIHQQMIRILRPQFGILIQNFTTEFDIEVENIRQLGINHIRDEEL